MKAKTRSAHVHVSADASALGETVRRTVSAFVRHVRSETSTLRTAQWDTLDLLERDGPATVAALARLRGVKHQSMRVVVAELEAAGWVTRTENPKDARAWRIGLTAAATRMIRNARTARSDWIARRIALLESGERVALASGMAILDRLTDAVD